MDETRKSHPTPEPGFDEHNAPASTPTIRHNQLARIQALVESTWEGVLLLVGEPGSGKSRLLAAIEEGSPSAAYSVRINPAEASLPGAGISAILAVFRDADAIRLSAQFLSQSGSPQTASQVSTLLSLFHDPERPPALLLVDDVDLMDEPSKAVLAMVATRLGGSGIRMIGTVSQPPSEPLASLSQMKLAPLELGEALALLAELGDAQTDEAVNRMVAFASNGNPAALVHHFRSLTDKEKTRQTPILLPFRTAPRSGRIPEHQSSSLLLERHSLLAQLSCAYLTSYEAIIAGSGVIAQALEELLSEGSVVHTARYVHIRDPLLRSRLYWSLNAAERVMYHRIAAQAEESSEPGLAAWHRSWMEPGHVAPSELLTAATCFARQGLIGEAVELAERALLLDQHRGDVTLLLGLVRAMFFQGELAFARRYLLFAQRQLGSADLSRKLAMLSAGTEFMSSQLIQADAGNGPAGGEDSADADKDAYALAVTAIYHAERWELDSAQESLDIIHRTGGEFSDQTNDMVNGAAMLVAALRGDPAPAVKLLDRLSQRAFAGASIFSLIVLGRSLTFVDRHREARRILHAVIKRQPAVDPLWLETARYALAENEILAGNESEAMAILARLNENATEAQLHRNVHTILMTWYWQAKEDPHQAEVAIMQCDRRLAVEDNPALSARLLAYQGRFALMRGHLDQAIAFLQRVSSLAAALEVPTLLRYQVDLIEAYALSGQHDEAMAAFREFRIRSAHYPTRWTILATARANALVTDGEESISAFQHAIKLWHSGDPAFELARTRLSFGDRLLGLGHVHESREQHLAARIVFIQLGAVLWAKSPNAPRPDQSAAPEHPLVRMLTTSERQIADMVCRGMRNKEIAAELFVSLRTVEVRLTKIYHKLHARSRSHLTAMLFSTAGFADNPALHETR